MKQPFDFSKQKKNETKKEGVASEEGKMVLPVEIMQFNKLHMWQTILCLSIQSAEKAMFYY